MKRRQRTIIDGNRPEVWPLEVLDRQCEEAKIPRSRPTEIPAEMQSYLLLLSLERAPWRRELLEDAA